MILNQNSFLGIEERIKAGDRGPKTGTLPAVLHPPSSVLPAHSSSPVLGLPS